MPSISYFGRFMKLYVQLPSASALSAVTSCVFTTVSPFISFTVMLSGLVLLTLFPSTQTFLPSTFVLIRVLIIPSPGISDDVTLPYDTVTLYSVVSPVYPAGTPLSVSLYVPEGILLNDTLPSASDVASRVTALPFPTAVPSSVKVAPLRGLPFSSLLVNSNEPHSPFTSGTSKFACFSSVVVSSSILENMK